LLLLSLGTSLRSAQARNAKRSSPRERPDERVNVRDLAP
jgi:hypothetical protein